MGVQKRTFSVHARTKAHLNQTLLRLSILLGCHHEKRTLDLFDAAVDDITEFITIKQMLRNYKDGSFGGCSGPSFNNLRKRKLARQDKVANKVMDNDSDDEPVELSLDMVNISENKMMEAGRSLPRKKKCTCNNSSNNSTLKAAPKTPRIPFLLARE